VKSELIFQDSKGKFPEDLPTAYVSGWYIEKIDASDSLLVICPFMYFELISKSASHFRLKFGPNSVTTTVIAVIRYNRECLCTVETILAPEITFFFSTSIHIKFITTVFSYITRFTIFMFLYLDLRGSPKYPESNLLEESGLELLSLD